MSTKWIVWECSDSGAPPYTDVCIILPKGHRLFLPEWLELSREDAKGLFNALQKIYGRKNTQRARR